MIGKIETFIAKLIFSQVFDMFFFFSMKLFDFCFNVNSVLKKAYSNLSSIEEFSIQNILLVFITFLGQFLLLLQLLYS